MALTLDSLNNTTIYSNSSSSGRKSGSIFGYEGYRQSYINDYLGRRNYSFVTQAGYNQAYFGSISHNTETYFYNGAGSINGGFGLYSQSADNTSTSLHNRGQFLVSSTTNLAAFGVRSDINMAYLGTSGAFAIRSNALQVGPAAGGSLPQGPALQVNSNASNTNALQRWQTTTDSVKLFLTSADPNSLITGRVGDLVFGTNGKWYGKFTGVS